MADLVHQAFGRNDVNLYKDVLKVSKNCSLAELRKAYYKQALLFHPDKNDSESAKLKFQAISWTYEFLRNPEKRSQYDDDGIIPGEQDVDSNEGSEWKDYFDRIFGKVSTTKIDEFSLKYKMSEDEEKDVLANYEKFRGDLTKMLEYVMLSEEGDLARWMEDYINPAILTGKVHDYSETSLKILNRISKKNDAKIPKKQKDDPDGTDTEDSSSSGNGRRARVALEKKIQSKKAKKSSTSRRSSDKRSADLIAAVRKRQLDTDPFAAIVARYGVAAQTNDPIDDDTFSRLQAKYKKRR